MSQATKQVRLVTGAEPVAGQDFEPTAFFDEDGNPIDIGGGGGVAWGDVTGKPSTFPPGTHTHTIANVTGLQDALDGKQASGSYAAASHTHTIANVTGLQDALDAITGRLDALEAATE